MSNIKVKQIPYGLADYERLVQKNCYYVDKTMYLKALEDAGDYLFFIRPRRFGKSLFLSVMEAYYDVYYKDRFEEFFRDTAIYSRPTGERAAYLMLKFNFSLVDPALDRVEDSFLNYVRLTVNSFIQKYDDYLIKERGYYEKIIAETRSASDILFALKDLCRNSRQKTYVIIDEYDNFANTILSTVGDNAYKQLTHGAGPYRAFFNVLKGGTDGMGAPFTRLFLTGVSPITLDDVTSGFNIGKNVSTDAAFSSMLGFTRQDVIEMIEYYRSVGKIEHDTGYLLEIMRQWYNHYAFSTASRTTLFNPDMVLYFLDEYFKNSAVPDDLIDRNVRIDYGKLRHLIVVDSGGSEAPTTNGNFQCLREIIEKGEISTKLVRGFPLEELKDRDNFVSLLFYFGLLTIKDVENDKKKLRIPNETVKRLYYDYIKRGYRESNIFDFDLSTYSDLMSDMAYHGKWEPLFAYITGRMRESMSLRDLISGEKSIQAFLNVYLGLSSLYIVHAEKEMNKGYADLMLEPFLARYQGIKYSYLLEIKYMKRTSSAPRQEIPAGDAFDVLFKKKILKQTTAGNAGEGDEPAFRRDERLQRLVKEAEEQLEKYTVDRKSSKNIERTTLIKLVLVFAGHELAYIGVSK